jgi:ribosomal silencing factor RsfS
MKVVSLEGKSNLGAEAMIFASGKSGAHLRRMADVLVQAVSCAFLNV